LIFIVRLKDSERTRILKLKDWPTKKDFASVFPTRLHDLMTNIPFSKNRKMNSFSSSSSFYSGDYTRRSYVYNGVAYHGGVFNIVERLPTCLVKPDLGPKLYIAYSQFLFFELISMRGKFFSFRSIDQSRIEKSGYNQSSY
jgi:lysine-specific demethylase 3